MNNRQKRKNVMKYLAGVLILLVSVFLAWILPESYGSWKDERMIGTVQLSEREKIEFLDGKSFEAQERWRILAEMDSGKRNLFASVGYSAQAEAMAFDNSGALWEKGVEIIRRYAMADLLPLAWQEEYRGMIMLDWMEAGFVQFEDIGALWEKGVEIIRRYAMADLLPLAWQEEYRGMIMLDWMEAGFVQFEDIGFPVVHMHLSLLTEKGELSFTLLMDLELQLPYYVSAVGADVMDGMARELGYTSVEDMSDWLRRGEKQPEAENEAGELDFTAAFEMDSVRLHRRNAGRLECEADAYLKETVVPIYRSVVERPYYGEGIAVCCGMDAWVDIQRHFAAESLNFDSSTVLNEMDNLIDTIVWKQRLGGVGE